MIQTLFWGPNPERDWRQCLESFIMHMGFCTANALYRNFETIIPRNKTARPRSQFLQYIHVSASVLYIPTISPQAQCSKIGGPIVGIYKSCRNWERYRQVSFLGISVSNFRCSVFVPYFALLPCTGTGDGEYRGVSQFHYLPLWSYRQLIPINGPLIIVLLPENLRAHLQLSV